jgi:hypothetical protein
MHPSIALITPSFAPDLERCRLLAESVERHVAAHVEHYIVVDRRDERAFRPLAARRTHVVVKQDFLPGWLVQLPVSRRWWVQADARRLVRGWVVQQVTKLSASRIAPADVFVFVDSDTFFIRPYDPADTLRDGLVPMFRELLPKSDAFNDDWHRVAARLLGLPEQACYLTNYVTQLVTWRRDNLLALHKRIEDITGCSWPHAIGACRTVSEYALYGVFCESVLGAASGHYFDERIDMLHYWKTDALGETQLRELKDALLPQHVGMMISAKSHTPVPLIRRVFGLT